MRTDKPHSPAKLSSEAGTTTASAPETRPTDEDNVGSTWNWLPAKVEQARTIPAEKPTAIKTEMSINECSLNVVKALENSQEAYDEAIRLLNQAEAHAAQLAEALRDALKYADSATEHPENKAAFKRIVSNALAAYEAAQ